MVLYFSPTGNSKYVAKKIAARINDETYNLLERIRNNDYSEIASSKLGW